MSPCRVNSSASFDTRPNLRKVQFITIEEDDKDLIVSFALERKHGDIESLILLRTLFYEEVLDEDERGVKVSLENDEFDDGERNVLVEIQIENDEMVIREVDPIAWTGIRFL